VPRARLHLAGGKDASALGHDVDLAPCAAPPGGQNAPATPYEPAFRSALSCASQDMIAVVVHAPIFGCISAAVARQMC
jgi:hypothetical protein